MMTTNKNSKPTKKKRNKSDSKRKNSDQNWNNLTQTIIDTINNNPNRKL